jgi:hypothetical protein
MDFECAYSRWREQPFPLGSSLDALDELHADLALVDTWVADALVPFVEHGMYRHIQVDPIQKLEEIRDSATELGKSADERRLARRVR